MAGAFLDDKDMKVCSMCLRNSKSFELIIGDTIKKVEMEFDEDFFDEFDGEMCFNCGLRTDDLHRVHKIDQEEDIEFALQKNVITKDTKSASRSIFDIVQNTLRKDDEGLSGGSVSLTDKQKKPEIYQVNKHIPKAPDLKVRRNVVGKSLRERGSVSLIETAKELRRVQVPKIASGIIVQKILSGGPVSLLKNRETLKICPVNEPMPIMNSFSSIVQNTLWKDDDAGPCGKSLSEEKPVSIRITGENPGSKITDTVLNTYRNCGKRVSGETVSAIKKDSERKQVKNPDSKNSDTVQNPLRRRANKKKDPVRIKGEKVDSIVTDTVTENRLRKKNGEKRRCGESLAEKEDSERMQEEKPDSKITYTVQKSHRKADKRLCIETVSAIKKDLERIQVKKPVSKKTYSVQNTFQIDDQILCVDLVSEIKEEDLGIIQVNRPVSKIPSILDIIQKTLRKGDKPSCDKLVSSKGKDELREPLLAVSKKNIRKEEAFVGNVLVNPKPPSACKIQCHICQQFLSSSCSLRIHYRLIHEMGREMFKCKGCNREFAVKSNLSRHVRSSACIARFRGP